MKLRELKKSKLSTVSLELNDSANEGVSIGILQHLMVKTMQIIGIIQASSYTYSHNANMNSYYASNHPVFP
jgi:hypothetical protein